MTPGTDSFEGAWPPTVRRLLVTAIVLLHALATCLALPPWYLIGGVPSLAGRHTADVYHVDTSRRAVAQHGVFWVYDPGMAAGVVTTLEGEYRARPQRILGTFLPFLPAPTVVALFLFLTLLSVPLWTLLACQRLKLPPDTQVPALLALLIPGWLLAGVSDVFAEAGAAITASIYLTPYVLALFITFLLRPGWRPYLGFLALASSSFLLHGVGFLILLPVLLVCALVFRPLPWRWRLAVAAAPVLLLALNAFWIAAALANLFTRLALASWTGALELGSRVFHGDLSDLATVPAVSGAALLLVSGLLAAYGVSRVGVGPQRLIMLLFLLSACVAAGLQLIGPLFPSTLLVPWAASGLLLSALAAIPVGVAVLGLVLKASVPRVLPAAVVVLVVVVFVVGLLSAQPLARVLRDAPDDLLEFIARGTGPGDRLLIQSRARGYLAQPVPVSLGREVVGPPPGAPGDSPRFIERSLWGRDLGAWSTVELRSALHRWGINWVFAITDEARDLISQALGVPGHRLRHYTAFPVPDVSGRLLIGQGQVTAGINRLIITDAIPEQRLLVLRYRFHPAWRTRSGIPVHRYPVPEDPGGFIALKNPGATEMMTFDPPSFLRTTWRPLVRSIPLILLGRHTMVTAASVPLQYAPYPPSPAIYGLRLDWSTHRRLAPGSDNWPLTWAGDDHQYTVWGDGGGFGGTNDDGRQSLGVGRVEGPSASYSGVNVWGGKNASNRATFGGKSYGLLAVDETLYMWVSPGSSEDNYEEARLHASVDRGASWTAASWSFTKDDGIILPTFLQFGKAYQGARDRYVYVYANHLKNADALRTQQPGEIALARVPRGQVMERAAYEFFAGLDERKAPRWTTSIATRRPAFVDDAGVGWNTSVSYNPGLRRYLLMTEHAETFRGNIGLFDAPEPWGPWTTVIYWNGFGVPNVEGTSFFWNFAPKWWSDDGRQFVLVFTGIKSNDSWNTVHGRFMMADRE